MKNFEKNANVILAEPLYIALQMAGYKGDAHEFVNRKLIPETTKREILLVDALCAEAQRDSSLEEVISRIPEEIWELLHHSEKYTGDAKEKALEIAQYAKEQIRRLGK
jgi:adenylosuccinate lyase